MFREILVGIDGSEHALKAAETAGNLARCLNANITLVACTDPIPKYMGDSNREDIIARRMVEAEEILRPAIDIIGDIPGTLSTDILEGPPAEVIITLAETRKIDLIVMGTRGLGRMSGFLFGSQSQKVAANANCPVMLVR